jgi:hypothetical protein
MAQNTPITNESVFISYARKDAADFARKLHDYLETEGIPAWLDVVDIAAGSEWNTAIDRAIESAHVVLVILTPAATESQQVMSEWNYALDKKITVLPLVHKECEIPRRLRVINYIDFARQDHKTSYSVLVSNLKPTVPDYATKPLNLRLNNFETFYHRWVVLIGIFIVCVLAGIAYEFRAASPQAYIAVQMLLAATLILIVGVRFIHRSIVNKAMLYFAYAMPQSSSQQIADATYKFFRTIFDTKRLTIVGILYGLGFGLGITFLTTFAQTDSVRAIYFFVFIFSINFMTGMAFYGLVQLFRRILESGNSIDFDFWERNNGATEFILTISGRISLLTCLYTSICINSVYFLDVQLGLAVHFYAMFAGVFSLAAYIVPTIPLRKRFEVLKQQTLNKLNAEITRAFSNMVEGQQQNKDVTSDREEINRLTGLRDKVDKIEIWPYSWRSLALITAIVLITLSPVVLLLVNLQR